MKSNKNWIKTAIVFSSLISFLLFWIISFNAKGIKPDPAFAQYISAYTSGRLSKTATVKIHLANSYKGAIKLNEAIDLDLFSFSPSVKGIAVWKDNQTIEFRPETEFESGTLYTVDFAVEKLIEVKSGLGKFQFQFRTIDQDYDVRVNGVKTYDSKNYQYQKLTGVVISADALSNEAVESILVATQGDKKVSIKWSHEVDRRTHHFELDSLQRGKTSSIAKLVWSGKKIGVEKEGELSVVVPALGSFELTGSKVLQSPEQCIILQFSDPIKELQNLDGLIRIANTPLKYTIDGNDIKIFPSGPQKGKVTISLDPSIKNTLGKSLGKVSNVDVLFEDIKPAVRLIGKGVIIPSSKGLAFPFEAVNLKAVDVLITKVFESNISQFLQVNDLDQRDEMYRVGKIILNKKIELNQGKMFDYHHWTRFNLDLAELIKAEPGAIYNVRISFKREYSTYPCSSTSMEGDPNMAPVLNEADEEIDTPMYFSDYDEYGYNEDYEYKWNERDDPCKSTYYHDYDKKVSRNILASNLGLIAKSGADGSMLVAITDLLTTKPIDGCEIEVYDFQKQIIAKGKTNGDGLINFNIKGTPFLVIAKKSEQRGYLKVAEGNSLSLSMFDISGEKIQKGLKGFLYGDRGVWRPGDSLFLTFILEDKEDRIPASHPVVFEMLNPLGQIVSRQVKSSSVNDFYTFHTATDQGSMTGNWRARVKVGGAEFTQRLKIETVMPNRLKLNLDFGAEVISRKDANKQATLSARWLHGAIAKNLKTKVEVLLTQTKTSFKGYPKYTFDDQAINFSSEPQILLDSKLNEEGKVLVKPNINVKDAAPGMLKANFTCRVFEEGGGSSIDKFGLLYSPFNTYVGIQVPGYDPGKWLYSDSSNTVNVVTLDENGKPVSKSNLEVSIYHVRWRWWWDHSEEDISNYLKNESNTLVYSSKVSTVNGSGKFKFKVDNPKWGRFYIQVKDPNGHSSGVTVLMEPSSWTEDSQNGAPGFATMLSFTADKETYTVGEQATISIPSSPNGRAFISIESGSKVLKTFWTETKQGNTNYSFTITKDMAPNVYVHVSLLQRHAQTMNDLPIRLYGIVPINVEDPLTKLSPQIKMPEILKPEEKSWISVSESSGKPMTYTIAVVDEGLLDLTRFKTPNPWSAFYAHQALGVKSFDMMDYVMGAYGGALDRMLSIGGDEELRAKGGTKAIRFKPMVRFLGPFVLKSGETKKHVLDVPQYIGSVKAMVVAGDNGAYGYAEKAVPVRKPIMIVGTLPRVLAPGEEVSLPINIFAMEDNIKNVKITVTTNNLFSIEGESQKSVVFKQADDDLVTFKLKVKSLIGVGKVHVVATSENEKSEFDIELDVRNPNPIARDVVEEVIEPNKTWKHSFKTIGIEGANKGVVEISSIPPINITNRLAYLIHYPYGCVEQTTSSVFPQLYLKDIVALSKDQLAEVDFNIKLGISSLAKFQTPNGGLSYWPGQLDESGWGTNYAGHFMIEAEKRGYSLPLGFLALWKKFQKEEALAWAPRRTYKDDLEQAYRLYTLALAGSPELGAMNRLREYKGICDEAKWRLAAAYQLAGQAEVANSLIAKLDTKVPNYTELSNTYGSDERDKAMILETLTLMGEKNKSALLVKEISTALNANYYLSTQTTAYCLMAVCKYWGKSAGSSDLKFTYSFNGSAVESVASKSPVHQTTLKLKGIDNGMFEVTNKTSKPIFGKLVLEGLPQAGQETASESDLKMLVVYKGRDGKEFNPAVIAQGTDFYAEVTVINPGQKGYYHSMALTQIFPSGWEIHNSRMGPEGTYNLDKKVKYQDICDDRINSFFDLGPKESVTFKVLLNASYLGRFYLPGIKAEAMYNEAINARVPGRWVEVKKAD